MKKILILLAAILVGAGALFLVYALLRMQTPTPTSQISRTEISFGTTTLQVDVANTEALREQGLSGRVTLGADAMLFLFNEDGQWGIWMKDMQFSIDILWLSADGVVLTVDHDVAPDTYPQAFYPSTPARYVLELPAGYAKAHGIAEGTKFVLH